MFSWHTLDYNGGSYADLIEFVRFEGKPVPTRYGDSREFLSLTVEADSEWLPKRERFNLKLLLVEAFSIIGGVYSREALEAVAPNAALHLFTEEGAYGPRLTDQMPLVVDRIRDDPFTRQAVAFVGRREDRMCDRLPCTIAIHFMVRRKELHAFAHMRSWDLVKGLAYDVPCFGWLNQAVADCVGFKPGPVHVTADSAHVYLADKHKIEPDATRATLQNGLGEWRLWRAWAQDLVAGAANWGDVIPEGIHVGLIT